MYRNFDINPLRTAVRNACNVHAILNQTKKKKFLKNVFGWLAAQCSAAGTKVQCRNAAVEDYYKVCATSHCAKHCLNLSE